MEYLCKILWHLQYMQECLRGINIDFSDLLKRFKSFHKPQLETTEAPIIILLSFFVMIECRDQKYTFSQLVNWWQIFCDTCDSLLWFTLELN